MTFLKGDCVRCFGLKLFLAGCLPWIEAVFGQVFAMD